MATCTDTCCRPYNDGAPDIVLLSSKRPVARKRYTCADCGKPIEPGTEYVRQFALIDGEPNTYIHHDMDGYCAESADRGEPAA